MSSLRVRLSRALAALWLPLAVVGAQATPRDYIMQGRELAQRCAYREALALDETAIAALEAQAQDDLLLAAWQDAATHANALLDYRVAESWSRKALSLVEAQRGRGSLSWALVAQNLAVSLAGQRKTAEAQTLFREVLAALPSDADPAIQLNARMAAAAFAFDAGLPGEGLSLTDEMAAQVDAPDLPVGLRAKVLTRIADGYRRALRLDEARGAAEKARVLLQDTADPRLVLTRAAIAQERGKLTEALEIVAELAQRGTAPDPCDPLLRADIAHRQGTIHMLRREVPEASAAFAASLREIVALDRAAGPREGETIYGLAVAAAMAREYDRAAGLFDRAAEAFREIYRGDSEAEAQTLIEKALMLGDAGRAPEGLAAARKAFAILQGPVEQGPLTLAYARAAIGLTARQAGEPDVARAELRRALAAFEKARGTSFDLAPGLTALGEISLARGDLHEADRLFRRTLTIQQSVGGDSAIALGTTWSRLAMVEAARGSRKDALANSREAVNVLRRRLAVGESRPWNDAEIERRAARSILDFDLRVTAASRPIGGVDKNPANIARQFEDIQLANATSAGASIAEMANRLEVDDPALSTTLRERSDLATEWRSIQDALVGGLADRRKDVSDTERLALIARQKAVEARLAELDRIIAGVDPSFDLLLKSRTVEIEDVRAVLRPGEALVTLTLAEEESYVVIVTPSRAVSYRTSMSAREARQMVDELRLAVDPSRWPIELPLLDTGSASRLYAGIFGPAEAVLEEADTILFVPDGPLASLPIGMLLTEPAARIAGEPDDYTKLPWLIRRFSVVNFPSAASLVALRRMERTATPLPALLGIGDPVLKGKGSAGAQRDLALRALSNTRLADASILEQLPPLPNTRRELMDIAAILAAPENRLLLGDDAREAVVRELPLDRFGLLVFATHGLVAGELAGYAEPALVLTPPARSSGSDDGLLSSSEIATLDLNAKWVILSACNTAAGDGSARAEPLSGLARAFFYAGARSLLVTNWAVDETAATITARTVGNTRAGQNHASALRETMLSLIDDVDGSQRTHPFFWASFTLIGN